MDPEKAEEETSPEPSFSPKKAASMENASEDLDKPATEDEKLDPKLVEEGQISPKSVEGGNTSLISTEGGHTSPKSVEDGKSSPTASHEYKFVYKGDKPKSKPQKSAGDESGTEEESESYGNGLVSDSETEYTSLSASEGEGETGWKPSARSGESGSDDDDGPTFAAGLGQLVKENENSKKEKASKRRTSKSRKKIIDDSGHEEEAGDFGQDEVEKIREKEMELLRKRSSWASTASDMTVSEEEDDDDIDGDGGMQGLIGRSEAKKDDGEEGQKVRRKRRRVSDTAQKDKESVAKRKKKHGKETEADEEDDAEKEKDKVWVEPNYNSEDFRSFALRSEECQVPDTLCRFFFSYGYDSSRKSNLHVLDDDTVVYISGNYLHFYSIYEQKVSYVKRSCSGYGLGHLCIHPSREYLAVGEKGDNPHVMIYTWPELKVYRVLRKGTTRGYAYVNFNPSGELLCSLGMAPDYMLTIWNWEIEKIVLRYKAYSQDVYRASFSPNNPGDLTTCGLGHIRFWKMAETFTGLKLQGLIGRFGKTEISDIQDYCCLSDGKVVSGSEWGNMLIWDFGLIVVELVVAGGKNCHAGEISEFKINDAELLTIGMDGYLRLWDTEILDNADTIVDDSGKYEVEPTYELRLASSAKLVSCAKSTRQDEHIWFLQDALGKVWNVNLSVAIGKPEYQADYLFYAPGGSINGICVSPEYTLVAVGSQTGHLWLIEYISKQCLARKIYNEAVTKVLWVPAKYDPRGVTIITGSGDGIVRLLSIHKLTDSESEQAQNDENVPDGLPFVFWPVQMLRYFKGAVLVMQIDEEHDVLYCCGADRVIFASRILWNHGEEKVHIEPLSYVTAPFPVISLDLHPRKDYRMIIAGRAGRVAECRVPLWGDMDTSITYNQGKLHGRRWFYKSVKDQRRREERRDTRKKEKEMKLEELYIDIRKRRDQNIPVDEEIEIGRLNDSYRRQQLADEESELYIPPTPCPLFAIYYCVNKNIIGPDTGNTFFVHVGGYDAGYIYECKCTREEPGGYHTIPPTPPFVDESDDLTAQTFLVSPHQNHLVFGMTDGTIRIMPRADPNKPKEKVDDRKSNKAKSSLVTLHKSSVGDDSEENSEESDKEDMNMPEMRKSVKKSAKKLIAPFPVSFYPYDLQNFWSLPMHDPDRGAVSALAFSPDNEFLFSGGEDGSIFAYRWDAKGVLESPFSNLGTPQVPTIRYETERLEDTEDPNTPTLEELKTKAEADKVSQLVDGKREVIRKELRKLKLDFRALVQRNSEIPEPQRVPRKDFEIDVRIREPMRRKQEEEIEEVYRKLEWRSLKSIIRCEKIEKYFLNDIATHHIIVKDLEHTTFAHSFRHRMLSEKYWELVKNNKVWMVEEELLLNAIEDSEYLVNKKAVEPVKRFYAEDLIGNFHGKKYDIKTIHAIRQLEDRLERRYKRQCEWAELNAQEVFDDYEDPQDVKAIKWAQDNMGDYKLRAEESYLGERITIAARRQRILDLKKYAFDKLTEFNHYIILLKEEKQIVIEKCHELQEEIKQLQKYIPANLRKSVPVIYEMEGIEKPEQHYNVTQEKIERRQAKKVADLGYERRLTALNESLYGTPPGTEEMIKKAVKSRQEFHANWRHFKFNSQLPEEQEIENYKKRQEHIEAHANTTNIVKPPLGLVVPLSNEKAVKWDGLPNSIFRYRKAFQNAKIPVAVDRRDRVLARRLLAQDRLLQKLDEIIQYFKNRVIAVRNERTELAIDMKVTQLAIMVRCEELEIVKEFDTHERAILDRLRAQKVELQGAKTRMDKVKKRMSRAENDASKIEASLESVNKDVAAFVAEKPRHTDYLWRVFRKRIKVEKDDAELGMIRSSGSDTSSSGGSDSTSVDSNSDLFRLPKLKLDTNVCPENLDKAIFDRVIEFRAKKVQLEMEADTQKKVLDRIKKDYAEVEEVYKKFQGRLAGIGNEVHVLQRKRQEKLNEIHGFVIVRSDQIQCLDEEEENKARKSINESELPPGIELDDEEDLTGIYGRYLRQFPANFNDILIFRNAAIGKLNESMKELKDETSREKLKQKGARNMLLRLQEELRHKEVKVKDLIQSTQHDMFTKFGRIVDMDELCACIINLEILDALLKLDSRRNRHYFERSVVEKQIQETKLHLTAVTKVNSEFNTLLAILEERRRDVDYFLHKQKKNAELAVVDLEGQGDSGRSNEDVEQQLFELEYQLLRQEMKIETLRRTIAIAKSKFGIPPLISMWKIPDKYGDSFMTYEELLRYKQQTNYQVETIYKKDNIMDRLENSESKVIDSTGATPGPDNGGILSLNAIETVAPAKEHEDERMTLSVVEEEEEGREYFEEEEEEHEDDNYPINFMPDYEEE